MSWKRRFGQAKYIGAILNSRLGCWFRLQAETIPIPKITVAEQRSFICLVDQILEAKTADAEADTAELEETLDWLVYALYALTNAEVAVVENERGKVHAPVKEEDAALSRAIAEGLTAGRARREAVMEILQVPDGG